MHLLYANFKEGLEDIGKSQENQINQVLARAEKSIEQIRKDSQNAIQSSSNFLANRINDYEREIRKWGEEKKELGKLGETFKYAQIIQNIIEHKKPVKELPIEIIERFTFAILYWVLENMPDVKIRPPRETINLDSGLSYYTEYRILALFDMLSKYFAVKAFGGKWENI